MLVAEDMESSMSAFRDFTHPRPEEVLPSIVTYGNGEAVSNTEQDNTLSEEDHSEESRLSAPDFTDGGGFSTSTRDAGRNVLNRHHAIGISIVGKRLYRRRKPLKHPKPANKNNLSPPGIGDNGSIPRVKKKRHKNKQLVDNKSKPKTNKFVGISVQRRGLLRRNLHNMTATDKCLIHDEGDPELKQLSRDIHGVCTTPSGRGRGRGRGYGRGVTSYEMLDTYSDPDSGIMYHKGDSVYLDSNRPDQPYFICTVNEFRQSKRSDNVMLIVKWYYRPCEVPDSVYQLLVQDRNIENNSGRDLVINHPAIKARELFISDVSDTYPADALRGKCQVTHYVDIHKASEYQPLPNTFFYVLGYNPETKRLATTQGEIRVGPSHQARLPECHPEVSPEEMKEKWEELMWNPAGVLDGDLIMYLRAARSMAAFAGMCDGGSTDDGCQAASMDDTTINALATLHKNSYDTGRALQDLVKHPVPRSVDKKWSEEETKRFVKGLRQYGKNFFKISRELLPYKDTGELIEYYYYWKKTPAATNARPHRRHRRTVFRRQPRTPRPPSSEFFDLSSASEVSDNDSDDSDSRDLSGYACRHCFTTTSKDWHHAGKDKALRCTECRLFFKKYGEERPIEKCQPPPFMFKPVKEDDTLSNGNRTMRTRRSKEPGSDKGRGKKDRLDTSTPDNLDSPVHSSASSKDIGGHKSPSTVSTCSNSSTDKDKNNTNQAKESSLKSIKRNAETSESEESKGSLKKSKSQERAESPAESSTDSSSVPGDDNDEENGNEGDIENNQDDLSSSVSSIPSPVENDTAEFKPGSPLPAPVAIPANVFPPVSSSPPLPEEKPIIHVPLSVTVQPAIPTEVSQIVTPAAHSQPPQLPLPLGQLAQHLQHLPQQQQLQAASHLQQQQHCDEPEPAQSPAVTVSAVHQTQTQVQTQDQPLPPSQPQTLGHTRPAGHPATMPHGGVLPPGGVPPPLQSHVGPPSLSHGPPTSLPHGGPPPLHQVRSQSPSQRPPSLPSVGRGASPHSLPHPLPHSNPLAHHPHAQLHPHPHISHGPSSGPPGPPPPLAPLPVSVPHGLPGLNAHAGVLTPGAGGYPLHPIKLERSDSPGGHRSPVPRPRSRSPIPRPRSRSPTLKSLSPTRSQSPLMRPHSRSRSRSPLRDSSPEPDRPRSPSPEPRVVNEECHKSKNAIFIKHLWRGYNTCSRCDIQFQPLPDSSLARKREDRLRKHTETRSTSSAPPSSIKEERKEEKKEEDKVANFTNVDDAHTNLFQKRPETPPPNSTADAQITSNFSGGAGQSAPMQPSPYSNDRLTPGRMPPFGPLEHTPALRQLSEYARPHIGGPGQEPSRSLQYSLGSLPPHAAVDPVLHYRMASMYPPGSRERLELDLQRDKQERDAREREIREREIREIEFREKMQKELEMKPPGFDRLPPGANPLDPHWASELQRRYGPLPPGAGGPHPGSHIPGVYPPASLANDLLQRERDRLERLGAERLTAERLQAERMALATDPMVRLQMAGLAQAHAQAQAHTHTHSHAHAHTHLHLHDSLLQAGLHPGLGHPLAPGLLPPDILQSSQHVGRSLMVYQYYQRYYANDQVVLQRLNNANNLYPPTPTPPTSKSLEHDARAVEASHLVYHFSRADPLAAAAAAAAGASAAAGGPQVGPPLPPSHSMPPGHPLLAAAREQELYRDLLSRPPYSTDPVLAHQLTAQAQAQQEALHRQLALEQERLGRHLPPH